jgi:hypothetical protein
LDLLCGVVGLKKLESLEANCLRLLSEVHCIAVDHERVAQVAASLKEHPPGLPQWESPIFPAAAGPQLDAAVILGNAVNFSYWVSPHHRQWSVQAGDQRLTGALAVFAAVTAALEDGIDLGDARTLDNYATAIVDSGDGVLPLAEERIGALREIATIVRLQFAGRLEYAIAAAGDSAPDFAAFLVETFPGFGDSRTWGDTTLPFAKRAQLAAGMLHCARIARGEPGLRDAEALTLYADYMLPRTLRHLGILTYSPELSARIDGQRPVPSGSKDEVALRIVTVAVGALLRQQSGQSTLAIDYWLWTSGFAAERPYHRTRCTEY